MLLQAKSRDWLAFLAVLFSVLALYVPTLSPGVEGGDPGEFQIVPYVLGIPHQTGYPLYILLGKLWTFLPIGSIANRMNLFSAVFASLTACLIFVALRTLGAGRGSSFIGSLAFTLTPLSLFWSTMAGVRSLAVLFFALLIWLALVWRSKVLLRDPGAKRWLYLLAFGLGLSLTHHRTIILAIPSIALLVALTQPQIARQSGILLRLIGLTLIPLPIYGYLWIRDLMNPPFVVLRAGDLEAFLELVIAPGTLQNLLIPFPEEIPGLAIEFVLGLASQFTALGIILGIIGLWALRGQPLTKVFLLTIFTITAGFALVYGGYARAPLQGELASYLLPAYFVFSIWIGLGVDLLWKFLILPKRGGFLNYLERILLGLAVTAMLVGQGSAGFQEIRQSRSAPLDIFRQDLRGEKAIRMAIGSLKAAANRGIILSDWEQYTSLRYYQLVEGWRPDLTIRYPIDSWQKWLAQAASEGRPFYLTRHLSQVVGMPFLTNAGPLVRLQTEASNSMPNYIIPQQSNFEGKIELLGYIYLVDGEPVQAPILHPGRVVSLQLYWQAGAKMTEDYSISLRLVTSSGQQVASYDALHPVLSMYPTSLWEPGEVVGDYYELAIPEGSPSGEYHIEVLVYLNLGRGRFDNLTLLGTEPAQDRAILGSFLVP